MYPSNEANIQIQAVKYDESLHCKWETVLLTETERYLVVYGRPGRVLHHHTRNQTFICDTPSLEYYDLQDGYTVNLDLEQEGQVRYYCNICLPTERTASGLRFVDLDLDLVRNTAGQWTVVDEDEFLENQRTYHYPDEVIEGAKQMLRRLQNKMEQQDFPFDGFLEKWMQRVNKKIDS
ncbi:DUF402 domain-containing protein [Exiguobacterium sp. s192]|uniref:DUF402 domain-containing protein n=1 Tax=Exiguobacterium sp. s192 TaxID=2751206 RepID=UPI001BE89C83|nr:DUF402 domain-containing protein [Exiguobacterium sp. s192]